MVIAGEFPVESRVPGRWYPGVMGRVVGPRGHVVYDDGTKAWLTPFMIAALCG